MLRGGLLRGGNNLYVDVCAEGSLDYYWQEVVLDRMRRRSNRSYDPASLGHLLSRGKSVSCFMWIQNGVARNE